MSCKCQKCKKEYKVDLIVPDYVWEKIKPQNKPVGGGLLCGSCIIESIEKMFGYFSIDTIRTQKEKQNNRGLWSSLEHVGGYEFFQYVKTEYYRMFRKKLTYDKLSNLTNIKTKTLEGYFSKGVYKRKFPWIIRRCIYLELLRYKNIGAIYKSNRKKSLA